MGKRKNQSLCLVLLFIAVGCSGTLQTSTKKPIDFSKYQHVYVVNQTQTTIVGYNAVLADGEKRKEEAIGDTPLHIKKALSKHGFEAIIGDGKYIPEHVDLVVVYYDEWQWDLQMYLKNLTITFVDRSTKKVMATGNYEAHGGGIHDYPTSEREAPNIIDAILRKL